MSNTYDKIKGNEEGRSSRIILWLGVSILLCFWLWAAWAEIDQVTRAPAFVIASGRNQVIQTSEGGVIEGMRVSEGSRVDKGDLLFRLDNTRVRASLNEIAAKRAAATAAMIRINAELSGLEPKFDKSLDGYDEFKSNQLALYQKRKQAFNQEIDSLKEQMWLTQKELSQTEPLLKSGDVGLNDIIKLRRQVVEIQGQILNRENRYFQELQVELAKVREEFETHEQITIQRRQQLEQMEVRSPVKGVVRNVKTTTVGAVLRPGEEVMQIVPVDEVLILEAKIKPSDVGFLKTGSSVSIKIDAYDYTIYGTLNGILDYISPDTLTEDLKQGEQSYYRAKIRVLEVSHSPLGGKKLELQPGMTGTAEIRTGTTTILKYLIKPIIKTLDESLGER